jgi:hypothetical protein
VGEAGSGDQTDVSDTDYADRRFCVNHVLRAPLVVCRKGYSGASVYHSLLEGRGVAVVEWARSVRSIESIGVRTMGRSRRLAAIIAVTIFALLAWTAVA